MTPSSERGSRRRLTDRQLVVYERLQALGRATVPDLHRDLGSTIRQSELVRILDALHRRNLVGKAGDDFGRYIGRVTYWSREHEPRSSPKLQALQRELATTNLQNWIDPDEQVLIVLVPFSGLERELLDGPWSALDFIGGDRAGGLSHLRKKLTRKREADPTLSIKLEHEIYKTGAFPALILKLWHE